MRDKEAVDNERKNLVRTLEKQSKVVDRLTEVEKQLRHQLVRLHLIQFMDTSNLFFYIADLPKRTQSTQEAR